MKFTKEYLKNMRERFDFDDALMIGKSIRAREIDFKKIEGYRDITMITYRDKDDKILEKVAVKIIEESIEHITKDEELGKYIIKDFKSKDDIFYSVIMRIGLIRVRLKEENFMKPEKFIENIDTEEEYSFI